MSVETAAVQHVGILLLHPVQFLDIGPVDILGMLVPDYLRSCGLPEPLASKGQPFVFHYISDTGKGSHAITTAGAQILITVRVFLAFQHFPQLS